MINSSDILNDTYDLWQRIGWLEPSETGYATILDTDNKASLSGKYFDALHPLCNFKKVKDTYSDSAVSSATINALLKSWQQTGLLTVLGDVFQDGILQGTTLENDYDLDDTLTGSNFVFVRIVVPKGFVFSIKSVGILLDAVRTFNLYVFDASKEAALVNNKSITTVANTETWTSWNYNLWGETMSLKSGVYYVGYFQSDLTGAKSIDRNYFPKNTPCGIDYCECEPNGVLRPVHDKIIYSGHTYGINLDYSVRRDSTNYWMDAPDLFDKALGYYVVIQCLKHVLLSDRSNSNQRKGSEVQEASQLLLELNGSYGLTVGSEVVSQKGLNQLYLEEIENIKNVLKKETKTVTFK